MLRSFLYFIIIFLTQIIHASFSIPENFTFHDSIIAGETDIVRLFIANGSNVNERYENGQTPLHLATRYGHSAITLLLL